MDIFIQMTKSEILDKIASVTNLLSSAQDLSREKIFSLSTLLDILNLHLQRVDGKTTTPSSAKSTASKKTTTIVKRNMKKKQQQDKAFKAEIRRLGKLQTEAKKQRERDEKQKQREKQKQDRKNMMLNKKQAERSIRKLISKRERSWKSSADKRYKQQIENDDPPVLKYISDVYRRYRIYNRSSTTIEGFLNDIRPKVFRILEIEHKVIYTICITMAKRSINIDTGEEEETEEKMFKSAPPYVLLVEHDFAESYDLLYNYFNNYIVEIELKGSGWYLKYINFLDVKLTKYNPLNGGCITRKLPKKTTRV